MTGRFSDQVALVTGAASGVGAVAVARLLAEGAWVVATDIRPSIVGRFDSHSRAQCVVADASSAEDWTRVVGVTEREFGNLDFMFANAGITVRAPLEHTDDHLWQRLIDINLSSVFRGARATLPLLREGGGAIVVNASINSLRGNLDLSAYAAAKAGALGLVRSLAIELAPANIRVNAVCPGTIDTPMTDEQLATGDDPQTARETLVRKHPLGRLATADDVAAAALFLGSRDSAFITGAALPVDGGRHVA